MNLFEIVETLIIEALDTLVSGGVLPDGLDFSKISVELPRDRAHGHLATNAAMMLAKPAAMNPRELAEKLIAVLEGKAEIASATVAGPGFINMTISEKTLQSLVPAILELAQGYGRSTLQKGRKINVEYVSANPTGPLHVGHTRGAVFGDALANLLDFCGADITREYYINDGGAQIETLARSAYLRYMEAHGVEVEFPDGTYPGDYLVPVGLALKEKFGTLFIDKSEDEWLKPIGDFAIECMMELIRADLAALGVEMDVFFSERSLYDTPKIDAAITALRDKDLIYIGQLEPPKGKLPEDWEARDQTLFRSTAYGDDVDRPIMKSDGSWTYFAPDIAYHYDKITRGFDELIDIFGADHGGYVKRMKAAVAALSQNEVPFDIKLCQLVKLWKNGEPFKMSKRAGNFVTLRDVVDQVGPDVTRFMMLMRKNDAPLDFDFDKVLEQSKDNPVFYVQYAHARICSVLSKAKDMGIISDEAQLQSASFDALTHPAEQELILDLANWPRLVEQAGRSHEPHRIAFYLYDLASNFHSLWNKGNDDPSLRFLQESDHEKSTGKLALIASVAVVISAGLAILGVTPVKEMR